MLQGCDSRNIDTDAVHHADANAHESVIVVVLLDCLGSEAASLRTPPHRR